MGYYTRYTGNVTGEGPIMDQFCKDADDGKVFGDYEFELDQWFESSGFNGGDTCKWYDWKSDCEALSAKYPNLLFTLEGEGEENGDLWRAYFRSGKSVFVKASFVYPEVDLDKQLPVDVDSVKKIEKERIAELRTEAQRLVDYAEEQAAKARAYLDSLS